MAVHQLHQAELTEPVEQLGLKRRRFTVEEYECMIKVGIFREDERIELIQGEIVEMTPIGFSHAGSVGRLTMLLASQAEGKAIVWVQNPIQLSGNSRPEPDVALVKPQHYDAGRRATSADVLLIIEVADTTLRTDRKEKGPLYAQAGIPEYWIVNLPKRIVEVYSEPIQGKYKQVRRAQRGETLSLPGGLGGTVDVDSIF